MKYLNKIWKTLLVICLGWLVIGSIVYIVFPWIQANNTWVKSEYSLKIQEIEFREGNRGVPSLKTDTGWYLLRNKVERLAIDYYQVGDSVVKKSGNKSITIFRYTENGELNIKNFP